MARGSSQYRLSTCQLGLNPIYFLVDEIFFGFTSSRVGYYMLWSKGERSPTYGK